ncbi:MAG: helix-turn-helix domain-containing protein [Capsulimonadaceae bacterium]
MDPVVAYAARALAAGDPLGALNLIALRDDGPGLALRGIAMAQLGDLPRAKGLLKSAGRAYGAGDPLARARCVLAEAEIALATRDLSVAPKTMEAVRATLEQHGDRRNAVHARFIDARRLLLIGRLAEAEHAINELDTAPFPPAMRAAYELVVAGIALRRLRAAEARAALERAAGAARHAGIATLEAEVETAQRVLDAPAARLIAGGDRRLITLDDVEGLLASGALIVDGCRNAVRNAETAVSLSGRPVLFALARAMGEAWPDDVPRNTLIELAFDMLIDDVEDRLRLRVEIGRLRAVIEPLAAVIATKRGFALVPHRTHELVVLEPPVDEEHAAVLALLADGEAWSSSALALALGAGQRSVQRALEALEKSGKAQACGRGRACRWTAAPVIGITTTLILPGSLPGE